ncbi:MAG: Rpp14/Pop5 family protein [Nanoarchaeota archaeon]
MIKIDGLEAEKENVKKLVIQAGLQFLGELGMARAGIQFLEDTWNEKDSTGIIRVSHKYVDEVKAALALVKEFEGKKITINSIKVSGEINKLK